MNDEWKKDRIVSAQNRTNPMVLAKLRSGYAVVGDTQFLPGYCVLLLKKDEVRVKYAVWLYPENNWFNEDKQFVNMKDGQILKENLSKKIEELKEIYYN